MAASAAASEAGVPNELLDLDGGGIPAEMNTSADSLGRQGRSSGGLSSIPEDGMQSEESPLTAAAKAAAGAGGVGALCAEEDQATLSQFMQISHTLSSESLPDLDSLATDLDPQLVNFLQRNARKTTSNQ